MDISLVIPFIVILLICGFLIKNSKGQNLYDQFFISLTSKLGNDYNELTNLLALKK